MEQAVENTQTKPKKVRLSNFDLLKIIAFIMVVFLHYMNVDMGGGLKYSTGLTNGIFRSIESLCVIAVPLFVLITGYFSYKSTNFTLRKVLGLFIIELSYCLICFFIDLIAMKKPFEVGAFFYNFLFSNYFINLYAFLMVLAPMVNKIFKLKKKMILTIFGIYFLFFIFLPSVIDMSLQISGSNMSFKSIYGWNYGYTIISFLFYYLLGGIIHFFDFQIKKIWSILIYIGLTALITLISYWSENVWSYENFIMAASATALFLFFKELKIKENIVITKLASCSLGVFVIHTTGLFVYDYNSLFNITESVAANVGTAIGNMCLVVFTTVGICVAADLLLRLIVTPLKNLLYNTKWMNYKIIDIPDKEEER